jgi:hypothetical protein
MLPRLSIPGVRSILRERESLVVRPRIPKSVPNFHSVIAPAWLTLRTANGHRFSMAISIRISRGRGGWRPLVDLRRRPARLSLKFWQGGGFLSATNERDVPFKNAADSPRGGGLTLTRSEIRLHISRREGCMILPLTRARNLGKSIAR